MLVFIHGSGNTCHKNETDSRHTKRDYRLIIDNVIKLFSLGKNISIEELQNAIPTTKEEFLVYYSYTYSDKGESINQSFYKIDSEIVKNATNNKGKFFILYFELSSFVDGEYAESYYDDVDFIIGKNKKVFCGVYKRLSENSRKKLEEYYSQYCH